MTALNEKHPPLRVSLWVAIVLVTSVLGYLLGYVVSAKTGVEPGFFERPEAGGYGVTADKSAAPGLDKDMQEYYNSLSE